MRTGSGAVAADQRRQRGDRGDARDDVVGKDRGGVIEARIIDRRPQPGDAGGGADQWSVTHPGTPRSGRPEGAALGQNDPGIQLV